MKTLQEIHEEIGEPIFMVKKLAIPKNANTMLAKLLDVGTLITVGTYDGETFCYYNHGAGIKQIIDTPTWKLVTY